MQRSTRVLKPILAVLGVVGILGGAPGEAIADQFAPGFGPRDRQQLDLDTSGKNRGKAPNGASGGYGGGGGGHAPRDGVAGGNAGDIELEVSRESAFRVRVRGFSVRANMMHKIDRTFDLRRETLSMTIKAIGGVGEGGGAGGAGGEGHRGHRGSDATRSSWGDDGGRGGRGGTGGDPSNGGAGGAGGRVKIRVPEKDADLLLFANVRGDTSALVRGGRGGKHGKHGQGGRGGDGGEGGSAYHGIETYTDTETDAKGNTRTVTKTRSIYQPGGSRGPQGPRGYGSTKKVSDGALGNNGSLEIEVTRQGKVIKTYSRGFDHKVMAFRLKTPYDIVEPGGTIKIRGKDGRGLSVESTGGMDTPVQGASLRQKDGTYIKAATSPFAFRIPPSLKPGQTFAFETDRALVAKVEAHKLVGRDKRAQVKGRVECIVHQPSLGVDYRRSSTTQTVTIQYPTGIDAVESLRALQPGQGTKLHLMTSNIINHAIGAKGEARRQIYVRVTQTEAGAKPVKLTDPRGKPIPVGELVPVATFSPREKRRISFAVKIPKGTPTLSDAGYQVEWYQSRPDKPDAVNLIQVNNIHVRVTDKYRPSNKPETLLVASPETPAATIKQLMALGPKLHENIDILNVAQEGKLPAREVLSAYKTILIDGAKFKGPGGKTRSALDLMTHEKWSALQRAGTNLVVLNVKQPAARALIESSEVPISGASKRQVRPGLNTFGQLKRQLSARMRGQDPSALRSGATFSLSRLVLGSRPPKGFIARAAAKLSRRAERRDPTRNLFFITDEAAMKQPDNRWLWGLITKHRVGQVTYAEAPSAIRSKAIATRGSLSLKDPTFWFGYVKGQEPAEKLEAFTSAKKVLAEQGGNTAQIKAVYDALLSDIVDEQYLYRRQGRRYQRNISGKLSLLAALASSGVARGVSPDSAEGKQMIDLLAHVDALALGEANMLQRLGSIFSTQGNVSSATRKMIDNFVRNNFNVKDRQTRKAVWNKIKARRKQILTTIEGGKGSDSGTKVAAYFATQLGQRYLSASSARAFDRSLSRVIDKTEAKGYRDHNTARRSTGARVVKMLSELRGRLLIPRTR